MACMFGLNMLTCCWELHDCLTGFAPLHQAGDGTEGIEEVDAWWRVIEERNWDGMEWRGEGTYRESDR